MKTYRLLLLISIVFCSCVNQTEAPNDSDSENEGIDIITKLYENSKTAIEYEIPVAKGTTIKHGTQKRFYQSGSLYSEINYVAGNREGTAYTYYPVGKNEDPLVWKEQSYVNNKLEGICKRYHRNGKLQAEYEYKKGLPATGLKEYYQSGNPVNLPDLVLNKAKTLDNYYISAKLTDGTKDVDYYIGELIEGKYLPENLKGLQVVNGLGEILVPLDTKKVTITAVMFTDYDNRYIVSKSLTF